MGVIEVDGITLEVRDVQPTLATCCTAPGIIRVYWRLRFCTVKSRRGKQKKERHQPLQRPTPSNWALWTKLGDGVNQRGSDNDADRLRFDFFS